MKTNKVCHLINICKVNVLKSVCMKLTVICIVKALFVFATGSVLFKNVPQMILLFDSVGMIMNFIFNNCRNP